MPETTNAEDHRKTKKIKDNYLRQSLKSFNIYQVVSSLFWCSFVSYPVNASDFALGQSLMARGMDFPIYPSSRQLRTQYHPTLRNTIYYAGQFDDFTKCTVTLQTLFFSLIYVFNEKQQELDMTHDRDGCINQPSFKITLTSSSY